MDLYRRLLAFVRPYRGRVALAILFTIIFSGATSAYAFLLGPLLKTLLAGGAPSAAHTWLASLSPRQLLVALPLLLIAVAAVRSAAQGGQSYLMQSTGQRVVADLRRALYGRFLQLPQAWLNQRHSGDLISRFGSDVQSVEFSLTTAFSSYVKDPILLLTLLGVCAWLDWRLFLLAVAAVPIAAFPIWRFARALKRVSVEGQAALGELTGQAGEAIANVRIVQAFGREQHELARLDAAQGRYLRLMRRSFLLRAAFSPLIETLGVVGLAGALYFAGSAIARGSLSGETLMSFVATLMFMYRPVKDLTQTGHHVLQGLAAAQRIFEVIDVDSGLPAPAEPAPARFERSLGFRGVRFGYGDKSVLDGLELSLPRGRTLAVVGESGAGKSTLAALALRFYDPLAGAVELDGVDIRSMALRDLRRVFAFVPQEPVLFAGTLRDNVACGRESPVSDEEIVAALEAAHARDFVQALEGGLDSLVGERGAGLSGGQRQRIALARAIVSQAPVIVLDEATSALDSASEAQVQRGLRNVLRGRTALVIAHRLSTVVEADEIAVIAGGGVVERGTHASLLAQRGAYAALWAAQGEGEATAAQG